MLGDGSEYYKMTTEDQALPIRWTAIEIFASNTAKFTEMSDCWAFAILCIEAFQLGDMPYGDIETTDVPERVMAGYIHPQPTICPDWIYQKVIEPCLVSDPFSRLGFETICRVLETSQSDFVIVYHAKSVNSGAGEKTQQTSTAQLTAYHKSGEGKAIQSMYVAIK